MTDPHHDLDAAMAAMTWSIEPGSFALVGFAEPPDGRDLEALEPPAQLIREVRETTLLIRGEAL